LRDLSNGGLSLGDIARRKGISATYARRAFCRRRHDFHGFLAGPAAAARPSHVDGLACDGLLDQSDFIRLRLRGPVLFQLNVSTPLPGEAIGCAQLYAESEVLIGHRRTRGLYAAECVATSSSNRPQIRYKCLNPAQTISSENVHFARLCLTATSQLQALIGMRGAREGPNRGRGWGCRLEQGDRYRHREERGNNDQRCPHTSDGCSHMRP